MKLILVLAAVIALGSALPATHVHHKMHTLAKTNYNLHDDLQDFLALLPVDQILGITLDYLANDKEVQEAFEFIVSDGFKDFILEVEAIPEYKTFLKYLNDAGLDVYGVLQKLHDLLELPPFKPSSYATRRGTGVRGLVDDIEAILPTEEIKALFYKKLETSPDFKNLIETMRSDEFKKIVNAVRSNPKYQELVQRAKDHGLDLELLAELLNKIFGWGIETRVFAGQNFSLKDDLHDFVALLPIDKILGIVLDYLANDKEVQEAFEFIISEDFKKFILEVEAIPEYKEFLKYLNDAGLDVYGVLQKLHDLLELPPFKPSSYATRRGTGVRGLVDDIEAILPTEEIKALFYKKLETSPDFKNLIETMRSDEFKKIVNAVRSNPKYQELVQRAKDHGLDLELLAELLNKIFGWGIETRVFAGQNFSLKDDLHDFVALLPIDRMLGIVLDYLANDKEVQEAFEFITSEDFKKFILEVEAIPEYKKFLKYLNDAGLDVYGVLQKLHDLLKLPPFKPIHQIRRGTGMRGLVDDLEAILPTEAIKALYYKKLETSADFKNLIETMRSDEIKKLVSEIRANPQYQELVKRAKEHGLDLKLLAELLNKIFGWGIETKH